MSFFSKRASYKGGKEGRKSLLENDNSRKVEMQNWEPLDQATMAQQSAGAQQAQRDQRSLSSGIVKPQSMGNNWTQFKSNNPFEDDTPKPAPGGGKRDSFVQAQPGRAVFDNQVEGQKPQPQQAQAACFSAENPFSQSGFAQPAQHPQQPQVFSTNGTTIHIQQTMMNPMAGVPQQSAVPQQPVQQQADPFQQTPMGADPFAFSQAPQPVRPLSADALSIFDPVAKQPDIHRAVSTPVQQRHVQQQKPTFQSPQPSVASSHAPGQQEQNQAFESLFGDMFATPGASKQDSTEKSSDEGGEKSDASSEVYGKPMTPVGGVSGESKSSKSKKKKKKKRKKKRRKHRKSKKKSRKREASSSDSESSSSSSSESESQEGEESPPPKAAKVLGYPSTKATQPKEKVRTEALAELCRGTAMLKFPRRGRGVPHFKYVQLTRSRTSIYLQWFSKKKPLKQTTINIADMDEVLQGKQSDVFQRFEQETLTPAAFSILYNRDQLLDLVAKSVDECNMWVKCLKELIKRAKQGQDMTVLSKIWINGLKYVDRNRPKRGLRGKSITRANAVKQSDRNFKGRLHDQVYADLSKYRKRTEKMIQAANSSDVRQHDEHANLLKAVSDLEERLDELLVETRESLDTDISKRDVWRYGVDLGALEEKIKVLANAKNFHLHP